MRNRNRRGQSSSRPQKNRHKNHRNRPKAPLCACGKERVKQRWGNTLVGNNCYRLLTSRFMKPKQKAMPPPRGFLARMFGSR